MEVDDLSRGHRRVLGVRLREHQIRQDLEGPIVIFISITEIGFSPPSPFWYIVLNCLDPLCRFRSISLASILSTEERSFTHRRTVTRNCTTECFMKAWCPKSGKSNAHRVNVHVTKGLGGRKERLINELLLTLEIDVLHDSLRLRHVGKPGTHELKFSEIHSLKNSFKFAHISPAS